MIAGPQDWPLGIQHHAIAGQRKKKTGASLPSRKTSPDDLRVQKRVTHNASYSIWLPVLPVRKLLLVGKPSTNSVGAYVAAKCRLEFAPNRRVKPNSTSCEDKYGSSAFCSSADVGSGCSRVL